MTDLETVQKNGLAIRHIKNPTREVIIAAAKQNPWAALIVESRWVDDALRKELNAIKPWGRIEPKKHLVRDYLLEVRLRIVDKYPRLAKVLAKAIALTSPRIPAPHYTLRKFATRKGK